ncbi:MAG: LamG domain-containing protein, partial [Candidatus Bathyarchaeota archaeon]|nr:LamG domain-containing protein [Candidatus Bathyarchaeota archaeon]
GSLAVFVSACGNTGTYTALTDCTIRDQDAPTSESGCIGDATNVSSGDKEVGASHNNNLRASIVAAIWQPADCYLDLEVQFTNVIDFLETEKLCIYTGTLGSEDLRVDYWNGAGWENLSTDLIAFSCNEYNVSLTSTTFTIRFKGGNETGDAIQDQWQIDASLLRIEGAGSKEDAVDQQSDVDSSTDVGTHSDFNAMKTKDGYDNLTESMGEQQYTFFEDWESGSIASENWTTYSSAAQGRIVVATDTPYEGSYALWMDVGTDGIYSLNELITNFDFSGATQVVLDFYHNEYGDENHAGSDHTDHQNADGVYYTLDGSYWYHLLNLVDPLGWTNVNINVTADTDFQGPVNSSFAIKFTQYDNYPRTNDGRGFENINITYTTAGTDYTMDLEVQWIDLPYLIPNGNLSIYGGTMGDEDITVDVWNGTGWETVFTDLSSGWNNESITDWLTTTNFTIRFKGGTETGDTNQDTWQIDVALIHVWHEGGESYELDLEVQWTTADYTRTNEELCIKTGTFSGSENIQVKVWNNTGNSWHWVMNLTANKWNNVSITSYLTASTFTVQFLGGTETGDITQDNWNIDATLLHVWTSASTWLSGWDKRVKITIDHNDIDSDLSDFPVLVYLSNSSGRNNDDVTFVFDEVGSNRKKIAVTKSDGTTQCYVEIDKWDDASEQAWLWVKVPSISSTIDTDLYLYFDSFQSDNTAYVGDKESTPAQNVWNTNFKGVWHLDEDPSGTAPQMRDSTSNNNDGTSSGTMTSGDQVAGKIDGSLDFDGTNDYIQTPSNELQTLENFTMSVWFKTDTTTNSHHILWEGPASENGWGDGSGNPNTHEMHLTICKYDANNTLTFFYGYEESGGNWEPAVEIITPFSDTTSWNHVVVVMTGAGTSPSAELFLNGVSQGTDTGTQTNRTAWDTNLRIGRPGADQRYFDGMIDEVRILETTKSASWIKASFESGRDDLLDFGAGASEDTSESTYDYVLRVNNTVTNSWQIRLKKYADSNVNRLQNCTICFHNSTGGTSNQIIIENGSYVNQIGPWYDLGASKTIYIAMTVQANSAATSYVYAYLEIRTPNTTTYAQYAITFEIT